MWDFIETRLFTRLADRSLSDRDLHELQLALAHRPRAGPVIPGTGGVRKLRWVAQGRGKRGGLRIVYYVDWSVEVIWLLTLYPKSQRETIAPHLLRQIREEIDGA